MPLVDALLPRSCVICGAIGQSLCARCRPRLVLIAAPWCERCGAPGPWPVRRCAECAGRRLAFATARAAVVYDDTARRFVAAWKERARRDLTTVAAEIVVAALARPKSDAIAPVPPDHDRSLRRGHATAAALARELAEAWEIPALELLERRPGIGPQRGLPRARRRSNVARAFRPRRTSPRRVCLVDDVYTTGSTVTACATELRRAGARHVDVVCFARAVR
jgi:ComF family protein